MGVRAFLFGGDLAEGTVQFGHKEERVVSEARRAPEFAKDDAVDGPLGNMRDHAVACEGKHADETGVPVSVVGVGELAEELVVVGGVLRISGQVGGSVTRGVHAGSAVEGVDFESAVVGENECVGNPQGVFSGFQASIGFEGVSGLFGRGAESCFGDEFEGDVRVR